MSFLQQNIFADKTLCIMIDALYSRLASAYPPESGDVSNDALYKHFLLSGKASAIVQGATSTPVKNIVFQTDSADFFKWCSANLPKLFSCKAVRFKNHLFFYPKEFYFEIWISKSTDLEALKVSNIYFQKSNKIPTETL